MSISPVNLKLEALANFVKSSSPDEITFTILEIGARPLGEKPEPFHHLVNLFPGSEIIAFELEKDLCDRLNRNSSPGIVYYPVALGRADERRQLYITQHPMCTSLYPPNEKLLMHYHNMDVSMLHSVSTVTTTSLDSFATFHSVADVDFIKIDIQGAELDVFQGATNTLRDVVLIVSEVEFIPLYVDQPLFGDVSAYLLEQGFMLHKLLGKGGRSLIPTVVDNNKNFPSQLMWSDAVYIKMLLGLPEMSSEKLLKLSMLSLIYGSPDLTFHCFKILDSRNGSELCDTVSEILA